MTIFKLSMVKELINYLTMLNLKMFIILLYIIFIIIICYCCYYLELVIVLIISIIDLVRFPSHDMQIYYAFSTVCISSAFLVCRHIFIFLFRLLM